MAEQYTLNVINDSEITKPTFAVFAKLPNTSDYATLSLAWLTRQINAGNHYEFTWNINWGFAWASQGTGDGYQWTGRGSLPADPTSASKCKAVFSYDGDFVMTSGLRDPNGSTLWIYDDPSVPLPSRERSSVAVTLDGNSVCATDAGPNLNQTFTLHPTYYINAGQYVKGQMVDGSSVAAFQELKYEGRNRSLTATLGPDNTWTVRPTAEINFAEYFAAA